MVVIKLLRDFASHGVSIFTDPFFVPSFLPGRCSRAYADKMVAINAHVMNNCMAGLGFIVSREAALLIMPKFHLQNLNLAGAAGKDKGRLACNCSGVA